MRVVRDYNTNPKIAPEKKPDSRVSYGLLVQYTKAINDKLATNLSYRIYNDDWDITSHTIESEFNYQLSDKFLLNTGIRYYTQSQAEFYSAKKDYFINQEYASSDRRMSDFSSINYKLGGDYKINKAISVNANINYYKQDEFDATYGGVGVKYRF
jgi:outer membrane receptor for ferrienterochelin and colicin